MLILMLPSLWSLQVAEQLGSSCQITASDINFSQCPPKELLPSNVKLQKWNVWDPLPEGWKGRFDLVHVRLIVGAFNDAKNSLQVLNKFVEMLSAFPLSTYRASAPTKMCTRTKWLPSVGRVRVLARGACHYISTILPADFHIANHRVLP